MIRAVLPAIILGSPAFAQDIGVCENIPYSQNNCVKALACIGDQGVIFEGRARGWDQGSVSGVMSDGTACAGTWSSGAAFGTGTASMTCDDGTDVDVIYYSQDGTTGTAIGRGKDSKGRAIRVWSGENVLPYLTKPGAFGPSLPCVQGDIPLS